ncbi:hypothetical protein [Variovorax paradoxus]|jgi:hypothetical protein|uniref:Uncharacterized protein n=1 Tax=Variovorax paradoxus TaxID=34073 RepID=A0A6I6H4U8_VARPD|nr:hypothetical protein [Variovorax paradoxus]QGW80399.1 hypothetical protein GOQ09_01785 [Variovorax paradoxus]
MGILSDFVIADTGSGVQIGESINPIDRWPTLQAKGVETIKLATLYCAISGKDYHNDLQKSFQLVGGDKEEGPWVFEFPGDILRCVARLDSSNLHGVAQAWQATEEVQMDGWSVDDASEFIRALSVHARDAVAAEKSLYLWLSL